MGDVDPHPRSGRGGLASPPPARSVPLPLLRRPEPAGQDPYGTKRRTILVAYGLTTSGRRELTDYRLVRQGSQGAWEAFSMNLAARGLTGEAPRLITTNGSATASAA